MHDHSNLDFLLLHSLHNFSYFIIRRQITFIWLIFLASLWNDYALLFLRLMVKVRGYDTLIGQRNFFGACQLHSGDQITIINRFVCDVGRRGRVGDLSLFTLRDCRSTWFSSPDDQVLLHSLNLTDRWVKLDELGLLLRIFEQICVSFRWVTDHVVLSSKWNCLHIVFVGRWLHHQLIIYLSN